jgi:hypothetical protein
MTRLRSPSWSSEWPKSWASGEGQCYFYFDVPIEHLLVRRFGCKADLGSSNSAPHFCWFSKANILVMTPPRSLFEFQHFGCELVYAGIFGSFVVFLQTAFLGSF